MKLSSRVAGVTGSIRGLGWEMVQAFAQDGAKVAICDLVQADVDRVVARLSLPSEWNRQQGIEVQYIIE